MRQLTRTWGIVAAACLVALLPAQVGAASAHADGAGASARAPSKATAATATPERAYMVERSIYADETWEVTLPSATVVGGALTMTVLYRNRTATALQLVCPDPPTPQSVIIAGTTTTESDSYCARNVQKEFTVAGGGTLPSWATFPVVPDLAVPVTLNDWYGWGSVSGIQLVPFECIVGPGGACLGLPDEVAETWMPTPPEWLTSPITGACVISLATLGRADAKVLKTWMTALGGALKLAEPNTSNQAKVYIVLTTAMRVVVPASSCADLAVWLGEKYLAPVAKKKWAEVANLPPLVHVK
jgi:hypothetical protein